MTTATDSEIRWQELLRRLATLFAMTDLQRFDDARVDVASDVLHDDGVEPRSFAVLHHLDRALAVKGEVTSPICVAFQRVKSTLRWRQNSSYARADFLDGYAYCELVGPGGHRKRDDVALGVLLLGPHVIYPEHAHPAAETYIVLSGCAQWRQGDGVWRAREPGERIRHASMEPHAMRTADEPLLAAYLWQDHLHEGARLLEGGA